MASAAGYTIVRAKRRGPVQKRPALMVVFGSSAFGLYAGIVLLTGLPTDAWEIAALVFVVSLPFALVLWGLRTLSARPGDRD
jgi:hypothetical protein